MYRESKSRQSFLFGCFLCFSQRLMKGSRKSLPKHVAAHLSPFGRLFHFVHVFYRFTLLFLHPFLNILFICFYLSFLFKWLFFIFLCTVIVCKQTGVLITSSRDIENIKKTHRLASPALGWSQRRSCIYTLFLKFLATSNDLSARNLSFLKV